jgi:hypothetical protein
MRLTRDEILLVTFILVALLSGALIKRYRDRARALAPTQQATPLSLPRPPEKDL